MTLGPRLPTHPIALALLAGAMVALFVGATEGDWVLVPATVGAFVAGRHTARWIGVASAAAIVAVGAAAAPDPAEWVPYVMLPLTLWLAGTALREHEVVARRLAAQGEELDAEREAYAALSVRYERARIAAELHDVVAHAISVMVVQATAGQRLASGDPAAAEATFRVIGDAARQASGDLTRLADLLGDEPSAPADLGVVETLVAQAKAAGLAVTLRLDGDRDRLRGEPAHALVRVVQEGLTNALRHAPGAPVRVHVGAGPRSARVTVTNAAPDPSVEPLGLGSGRGLLGLRERVQAIGGALEAGPLGAGWQVAATLPYGAGGVPRDARSESGIDARSPSRTS